MFEINLSSVFAMTILQMVLDTIWYSPKCFGSLWIQYGSTKKRIAPSLMTYSGDFFSALFTALLLAQFIQMMEIDTIMNGMKVGIMAWLGFVATTQLSELVWERLPVRLFLVHTGISLINLSIMGGVFAVWK